jgi:hypothetical protein
MSIWFRWHEGTCEDGKFRAIAVTVGVTPVTVIGLWAMLLEDASHSAPRGIATRGLTFWHAVLGMERDTCEKIINEMEEHGLVTWTQNGDELLINNWKKRQFESDITDPTAASRQKNYRERKRHADKTARYGGVTAELRPENREQITDTEKKEDSPKREARLRTTYPEDFENGFWKPYPTSPNMSKSEALAAWKGLSEEERKLASAAVPAFKNWLREQKDHPVVHACRFLKQRRFEGFTAHGPPQSNQLKDELEIIRRQIAEAGNGKTDSAGGGRVGADNVEELRPARAIAR